MKKQLISLVPGQICECIFRENMGIPVRLYESPMPEMDDEHELTLTGRLNWPAYDVFVWYGARKRDCIKDVPVELVDEAIEKLREKHSDAGVIGVVELGYNNEDARSIARCGVGIH